MAPDLHCEQTALLKALVQGKGMSWLLRDLLGRQQGYMCCLLAHG